MSLLAAAAIGAGIGAAGNALGSAQQSAMGYYMSKKMAQYNYDLQKKGYQEFPTAQVAGLRAAGINPMVAYGGIAGATAHAGNYQAAPGSDLGSSALNNYRENKKLNPAVGNILADTKSKIAQGNAAEAQAGAAGMQAQAALINAKTNAKRVDAEISLMQSKDPTESGWGVADKILSHAGDIGTTAGGAAIAYKTIKEVIDKNKNKVPLVQKFKTSSGRTGTITAHPGGYYEIETKPKKIGAIDRIVNSAKSSLPVLMMLGKGASALGLGTGAIYGSKKLMDKYDESKNAKKIKDEYNNYYQHGNWSR